MQIADQQRLVQLGRLVADGVGIVIGHYVAAIFDIARRLKEGQWKGGETVVYSLANDGVGIAPTSAKHVPADILKEVDGLVAKIKAGEIVVPATLAEFKKFK